MTTHRHDHAAGTAHIEAGLRPGDIGEVVALHAREYATLAGFGTAFEALIATDVAEFATRNDPFSRIWLARDDAHHVVGSIAIDRAHDIHGGAHLRWFLIDHRHRGGGLGHQLLGHALRHCDEHRIETTMLWTFEGLDAARALYERHGFHLTEEKPGSRWGTTVVEQRFLRPTST